MTLLLWTGADAQTIRKVLGPIVERQPIRHHVIPFPENKFDSFPIPVCGPGDVILACGVRALDALRGLGVFPKPNKTVGSNRERPVKWHDGHLFVTYDPGMINVDYARFPEIQWDAQLAIRMHEQGHIEPKLGEYRWVESFHELIEEIDRRYEKTGKPVYLSCDTETMGLDEYNPNAQILSISFTIDEGRSDAMYFEQGEYPVAPEPWVSVEDMDYWQGVWTQLHWLLTTPKVRLRGANWKYDSRWINHKWAINCTNFRMDTLLVGTLLNENISNSLKMHAKIHTTMGGYEDGMDDYDMGHLEVVPKEKLLPYMGGDTDCTQRVANIFVKQLTSDHRLANFYTKLLHPSSTVFEKMERTGICVDVEYMAQLESQIEAEQFRLRKEMQDLCPKKLLAKYSDNFSFTRPVIIKDLFFSSMGYDLSPKMYTEKSKEPSTSVDHLMMFADDPAAKAFVEKLSELNSANKTMSTYVRGFMKHLRVDGRFHPHYMLFKGGYGDNDDDAGTDTGRCLTADAFILTDKGEISIKEVVERGEKGEQFRVLTHRNRWLPVTGFWRNGIKPVVKVKAAGRILTSTTNHPFMSFPSWTLAQDLKTGSWLYAVVSPPVSEEWKPIPDWPFEVSNMGRVRRAISGKNVEAGEFVAQRPKGPWGHLKVTLTKFVSGREKQDFSVHKLVADAFLGTPTGVEIAHLNGDASCNWSTNLKWVSVEDNKLHQRLHGTYNREIQKKLTWEAVDAIRAGKLGDDNEAAAILGVSRELVRDVRNHLRWTGRRESMVGFMPVRVDSVVLNGMAETYDLTVDEDHSFVANGLVVHNTSAKDPAVQTIPKHTKWAKKLRRAYVAPPGMTILQLDFSQGELKIAACLANEQTMINAYQNGIDLHAITAARISGYEFADFMLLPEDVRDELRSRGKAGNFGLLYGMGAEGFQNYAFTSYGVKMTLLECEQARDAFFELYYGLPDWHETYKNLARRFGEVRSPLGRVRHLPLIHSRDRQAASKAGRNAINSPVQSTLSDMMQLAMVMIDREYGDQVQAFLMTHDACCYYVPTDEAHIWAKRLKEIMDNLPLKQLFGWDHQLPFTSDAEVAVPDLKESLPKGLGDGAVSLASLKKVKVLA